MLTWLRAAGAQGLDNVEVKETAYGGLGVFLAAPVETTSIASVPVECCVTATAALTRPVGRAAREILPDCADEFVLVLDAATGRRDATHPQHAYLSGGAAPLTRGLVPSSSPRWHPSLTRPPSRPLSWWA